VEQRGAASVADARGAVHGVGAGRGLHSFTLELNSSNSRTHSSVALGYSVDRGAQVELKWERVSPWELVTATLLRRLDVLEDIIDGRSDLHLAWAAAVSECAGAASDRGDHAQALFLMSLRQEMAAIVGAVVAEGAKGMSNI